MKYLNLAFLVLLLSCQSKDGPDTMDPVDEVVPFAELSAMIAQDSNNLKLLLMRAQLSYEQEYYDQAIKDLNKAKQLAPSRVSIRHRLADAYLDYYRSREALAVLEEAVQEFPDSTYTALKLSEFQFLLKQYDASLETVGNILLKEPSNAEAYFMMGQDFKAKQDTPRAINSFQTAVEYDRDLLDAWIELGNLFAGLDNPIAIQYFQNAIRVDSLDVFARFAMAYYLQTQGDTLSAIKEYEKIIGIDYNYSDAFLNAGILYLQMDSLDHAYKKFDQMELLNKTDPRPYYFKGQIYQKRDDAEQAKKLYEQALRIYPDFTEAQQALNQLD